MSNDPAESVTVTRRTAHWPVDCYTCGGQATDVYYLQDWVNERTGQWWITYFCPACHDATGYLREGTPAHPADTRRALTQWAENVISHAEAGDPTDPDETLAAEAYLDRKDHP
ncbi:hypothetical protein OS125_11415 [Corynebacterium sp. P7003]|uniref:Small CPxCG-related zinc finger protein n=1 Tax=Corynebacterium pygosceleis TaxID=2800406 RepID=A0ABT3WUD6_9CORY|nr:hypothetical protein [Corynebacterium pygosceleis]MCX7445840.1 hypothetical protein [Corynebacterium pygosceleis]